MKVSLFPSNSPKIVVHIRTCDLILLTRAKEVEVCII
jgi:hypothetical protein